MDEANARLAGRHVTLRAIEPTDYSRIRQAEVASSIALRWRLAGQHVPPEQFAESLFGGVLATFIYERPSSRSGFGVVTAYSADPRNGFAYFGAAQMESFGSSMLDAQCNVEAIRIFIDFLFAGWNLRKIYLECAEFNAPQFGRFLEFLDLEARQKEHLFLAGRYWALDTYAIWRKDWPEILRSLGL